MTAPIHVLVTRPAGQADGLVKALENAGYRVTHQPALSIEPLPLTAQAREAVASLDHYHAVVLVSANAARLGLAVLQPAWSRWPPAVAWVAVGEATARVLRDAGLEPVCPRDGFNSEAVLELPALADIHGRKILILSGATGRALIEDVLAARGATVDRVALYRRGCTPFQWPARPVDVLMVTSLESWQCIADRVPRATTVIAASERVARAIEPRGFRVLSAASAHDADMMATLSRL